MTSDTDTSKKESHGFGLVALALLPVAYVAMTGPIVLVFDHLPRPLQKGLETAYFPLAWACENNKTVGKGVFAYMGLWGKKQGKARRDVGQPRL